MIDPGKNKPDGILRIAMWSGPRNISTALMRSWGNRPDTRVCDEPFYAHYLVVTGKDHPGRTETLTAHDADWRRVVQTLIRASPTAERIFYQKHMAHHLLPVIDKGWITRVTNCFLIRDPREMLTSLLKHVPDATLDDTGLPQQVALFNEIRQRTGTSPPVMDARDVLENPEGMLRTLCAVVGVAFEPCMLSWPMGDRSTDGAWGPFWYKEVYQTTTFGSYAAKSSEVPESHRHVLEACQRLYNQLHPHCCRPHNA